MKPFMDRDFLLHTETAKRLAEKRHAFLEAFLQELAEENASALSCRKS